MNNDKLAQFAGQTYLSIETYRKSGQAVPTPVWFLECDGMLYVHTSAHSGKVKRIHNNPRVRVTPSDMRGKPKGEWVEGQAHLMDAAEAERVDKLFNKKYGLPKRMFDFLRSLQGGTAVVLEIKI